MASNTKFGLLWLGLLCLACGGDGDSGTTDSDACTTLEEAACAARADCAAILAHATAGACDASGTGAFAGCQDSGAACEPAITCGTSADGDHTLFASACLPAGWTAAEMSACCKPDWYECAADSDCVVIEMGCCDHCNGGFLMSLHPDFADEAQAAYAETGCEDKACTELACSPAKAACKSGVCAWESPDDGCDGLDEAACESDAGCVPARLGALPAACGPDPDFTTYVGCVAGCSGAAGCAVDPATGTLGMLPESCLPKGWKSLAIEGCCPAVDCGALSPDACDAEATCQTITGAAQFASCAEGPSDPTLFCAPAAGCDGAETCGVGPDGSTMAFPSSCLPIGWTPTDSAACCPDPCPGLAPDVCEGTAGCAVLAGAPSGEICEGDYDNWMSVPVGCQSTESECGDAETCAQGPDGTRLVFASTCLPEGWSAVEWADCCAKEPCVDLPPELCEQANGCVVILGAPAAEICAGDYTNWMSEAVGCMPVGDGCFEAETCGQAPNGALLVFPTSCLPKGWTPSEACCPGPTCATTPVDACDAADGCATILGAPAAEVCGGDYSNWMSIPAGCMASMTGCDDAETCAQGPDGPPLVFPSSCIPAGWAAVDSAACCATEETCSEGTATPVATLCVRGTIEGGAETLSADAPVTIQVSPKGCFSSSCTIQYVTSCAVVAGEEPMSLAATGTFCLAPTSDDVCTPDCSGGGFAKCDSPALAAGDYTVSLEGLTVAFTVPSTLPLGGECVGSPF